MEEKNRVVEAFDGLVDGVVAAAKQLDVEAPQTSFNRVQDALAVGLARATATASAATDRVRQEAAQQALSGPAREQFAANVRRLEAIEKTNAGVAALVNLFREGDQHEAHAALRTMRHVLHPTFALRQAQSLQYLADLGSLRGEKRAMAAMRAIHEIGTVLYDPYARGVLSMLKRSQGNGKPGVPSEFGAVVKAIFEDGFELGQLPVSEAAAWLRNADAHGHRRYVPERDVVVAWDRGRPEREIPTDELVRVAGELYQSAGQHLSDAVQLHLNRTIYVGLGLMDAIFTLGTDLIAATPEVRALTLAKMKPVFERYNDVRDIIAVISGSNAP